MYFVCVVYLSGIFTSKAPSSRSSEAFIPWPLHFFKADRLYQLPVMLQVQCTVLALQLFQNRRKLLSLFFRISTSKFGADLPKIKGDILSVCDNPVGLTLYLVRISESGQYIQK